MFLMKDVDITIEQHILVFTKLVKFKLKYTFGWMTDRVYIRCVGYSALEYTESDKWGNFFPRLEFGSNIPKYSDMIFLDIFWNQYSKCQSCEPGLCQVWDVSVWEKR